jgi:hypothetical protein
MRRKRVFKEAIVRKDDKAEVSTPHLDEASDGIKESQEASFLDSAAELKVRLTAESREGMKKRAIVTVEAPGFGTFSMWCDEGTSLGGNDSAPPPLTYFGAGLAF